jgi:hypothetical protein
VLPKSDLDVQQTFVLYGQLVEHLKSDIQNEQSVTKIIIMTVIILVTPKAEAKHKLLFNKLTSVSYR